MCVYRAQDKFGSLIALLVSLSKIYASLLISDALPLKPPETMTSLLDKCTIEE